MALPTVWNGQPALGQVVRTISTQTLKATFWNGTEQRGIGRGVLVNFTIPFDTVGRADKDALRLAVAAAGGKFDGTLSFAFLGNTYTNLTLTEDSFQALEKTDGQWGIELHLRQTIPQGLTGTPITVFPSLSAGPTVELPYGQGERYQTDSSESSSGMHYAFRWFGAGLTGFPQRGLRRWPLSYPVLSDADLATIESAFIGVNGQTYPFTFVDPDEFAVVNTSGTSAVWVSGKIFDASMVGTCGLSVNGVVYNVTGFTDSHHVSIASAPTNSGVQANFAYLKCRCGQDDLAITHLRYGLSSIQSLVIEETN